VTPRQGPTTKGESVSLLWIILIVILVLALLGFFSRGRW
jgi:flagellar basal body-associated protein FliL